MADYPTYPAGAEDVTAEALVRSLLDAAQQAAHRANTWVARLGTELGSVQYALATETLMCRWALANALHIVRGVAAPLADAIAVNIWQGWDDGDTVVEDLWSACQGYGIPAEPDPKRQPSDD